MRKIELVLFCSLLFTACLLATIVTVPDSFPSVQEAVYYVHEGDTIMIESGFTSRENISITSPRNLTICGEDSTAILTLDDIESNMLNITTKVKIENLTIAIDTLSEPRSEVVILIGSDTLTIENCKLQGIEWITGLSGCPQLIKVNNNGVFYLFNSIIRDFRNSYQLSLIGIDFGGYAAVVGNLFENNLTSGMSGGMIQCDDSPLVCSHALFVGQNIFKDNETGDIINSDVTSMIINNLFIGNTARACIHGGAWSWNQVFVYNNTIAFNHAIGILGNTETGGDYGPSEFYDNIIVFNEIGIKKAWADHAPPDTKHNLVFHNERDFDGFSPDATDISTDPFVVSRDSLDQIFILLLFLHVSMQELLFLSGKAIFC